MLLTLEAILRHVDDDKRAALRRLHSLTTYHLKACSSCTDDSDRDHHAAKAGHYRALIDQLESAK